MTFFFKCQISGKQWARHSPSSWKVCFSSSKNSRAKQPVNSVVLLQLWTKCLCGQFPTLAASWEHSKDSPSYLGQLTLGLILVTSSVEPQALQMLGKPSIRVIRPTRQEPQFFQWLRTDSRMRPRMAVDITMGGLRLLLGKTFLRLCFSVERAHAYLMTVKLDRTPSHLPKPSIHQVAQQAAHRCSGLAREQRSPAAPFVLLWK